MTTVQDTELSLDEWLVSTQEKREALLAYSRSQIPTDPGERQLEISLAIQQGEDAGELEADAEGYLTQAIAQATLDVKDRYDDYSADERKALVKDAVREVARLRDGMTVVRRAIDHRVFGLMNLNRSKL